MPAALQPIANAMKDKPLPFARRIEISIIEEGQARWLAFLNGEIDGIEAPGIPSEFVELALANGKLKPELAAKGIKHDVLLRPNVYFTYFNLEDPVVGGYTPEKIALRRAIGMAYNNDEPIRVLLKGRAVPAHSPIPADIEGYDPKLKTNAQLYDPAAARALLDKFGYKDRDGDGYPRGARRQAAGARALVDADVGAAAGRRAVEAQSRRDRAQGRVQEGQAPGASQDGAARQDPDARRRLERRLPGRRELHAAALRPERRPGEPVAVQPARVQQALRAGACVAGFSRSARRCSTG